MRARNSIAMLAGKRSMPARTWSFRSVPAARAVTEAASVAGGGPRTWHFPDAAAARAEWARFTQPGDTVVVKGSRVAGLEAVYAPDAGEPAEQTAVARVD
jgi:hypothetical protein